MKKLLLVMCCFACITSLLCFSACEAQNEETTASAVTDETAPDNSTQNADNTENAAVVISLSSEKTEVAPGEEFIVTCTVDNAQLFAACDLLLVFDEKQVKAEVVSQDVKDLYSFGEAQKSGYMYSAYVLYTLDMKDTAIFTIECVASESCSAGDEIEIILNCEDWLIGTDESGDELENITDSVITNSLSVKVR